MKTREWKMEDGRARRPLRATSGMGCRDFKTRCARSDAPGRHGYIVALTLLALFSTLNSARRVTAATLLTLLALSTAHAQPYSIDWSKVAGGGGTSSNAQYSVSGTIGQPDAGSMSGGNYTLTGGFWGVIAAVQTPGAPLLTITLNSPPSTVTVSWPSPSTGFGLQENADMNAASWNAVPPTNTDNGTIKSIVVPAGPGNRFYRLKK
jgi:hypothetical protein